MAGKDGDIIIGGQPGFHKPKGILDALAEIQQYYVVERNGDHIPEEFLTTKGKLGFFSAGLKTGFVGGLINLLLIPISIGVIDDYIPIFGNHNPGLFDKTFAMLLCISFSLGYAIFLTTIRKYYIGEITKSSIRNLLWGVTAGGFFKMAIAFIFFHFMYLKGFDEDFLTMVLLKLPPFVKYDTLNAIYGWLQGLRPVFLTSAYFVLCVTLLYVSIPWISVFLASRKTRKLMAMEERWK